mmetsp:Transcript_21516/g.67124  ORF Transcript_21516/g.67124 Transcript_21516/m.67124 type:complete len:466 (-) Transcript_21516:13-1410(-)
MAAEIPCLRQHLVQHLHEAHTAASVLQQTAQDAAAIAVARHCGTCTPQLFGDETGERRWHHLHDLLDHVVGVRRLDGLLHVPVQLRHEFLGSPALGHFECQLHDAAARGSERAAQHGATEGLDCRQARRASSLEPLRQLLTALGLQFTLARRPAARLGGLGLQSLGAGRQRHHCRPAAGRALAAQPPPGTLALSRLFLLLCLVLRARHLSLRRLAWACWGCGCWHLPGARLLRQRRLADEHVHRGQCHGKHLPSRQLLLVGTLLLGPVLMLPCCSLCLCHCCLLPPLLLRPLHRPVLLCLERRLLLLPGPGVVGHDALCLLDLRQHLLLHRDLRPLQRVNSHTRLQALLYAQDFAELLSEPHELLPRRPCRPLAIGLLGPCGNLLCQHHHAGRGAGWGRGRRCSGGINGTRCGLLSLLPRPRVLLVHEGQLLQGRLWHGNTSHRRERPGTGSVQPQVQLESNSFA